MVGLIRARVPRFHPSMWLDGVIGALGTTSLGRGLPDRPVPAPGRRPSAVALINLAMPVMDVLLLALLVAVGAILGLRMDRSLLRVILALLLVLAGDVVLFARMVDGHLRGRRTDRALLAARASAAPRSPPTAPPPAGRRPPSAPAWACGCSPSRSICNLASLFVLAAGWGDALPSAAAWLAIGCVVAAIARTAVTFREVRAFNEVKQQALTDELTGLANRRALLDAAARVLTTASARRPAAPAAARPRRLQGGQRQPRAHRGRPPAPPDRPAAAARPASRRAPGPARRRRVRRPAAGGVARPGPGARRAAAQAGPRSRSRSRTSGCTWASASASPPPRCRRPPCRRCCAAPTSPCTPRSPRARACTSTCPTRTAAAATGCAPWRNCATRCSSDQLVVHLQPQIALADERVVGVEALVRWNHPVRGLLSPADLLPAAEQAGLLRRSPTPCSSSPSPRPPAGGGRAGAGVGQPRRGQRQRPRPAQQGRRGAAPARPARRRRSPSNWSRTPSWPTPSGAARCSPSCAGSASAPRSTTTAPATARWPTCGTFPPTSSSSTGA